MGNQSEVARKSSANSGPSGAIGWRLSKAELEKWSYIGVKDTLTLFHPEEPMECDFKCQVARVARTKATVEVDQSVYPPWFGQLLLQLYPPFQYNPGPPAVFYAYYKESVNLWGEDIPDLFPSWKWEDYKEAASYFLISGQTCGYVRELQAIKVRSNLAPITQEEKKVLTQLIGTLRVMMQEIRAFALESVPVEQSLDNEWKVYPQQWKEEQFISTLSTLQRDTSVFFIARTRLDNIRLYIPKPTYYAPPKDIRTQETIVGFGSTYRQWSDAMNKYTNDMAAFAEGHLEHPPAVPPRSSFSWYGGGSKKLLELYYKNTFYDLATAAENLQAHPLSMEEKNQIEQGEPFGTWVGVFTLQIYHDVIQCLSYGNMGSDWNIHWPVMEVQEFVFPIQIGTEQITGLAWSLSSGTTDWLVGTKVPYNDPTERWPMPTDLQLEFLNRLASAWPDSKGTIAAKSTDVAVALSCYSTNDNTDGNRFYPLPRLFVGHYPSLDYELLRQGNAEQRNTVAYLYGGLLPYAIGLRQHMGGRPREQWIWKPNGELETNTPKTELDACEKRKREHEYLPGEAVVPCESPKEWDEPWKLSKEEFYEYLKHRAPMPNFRQQALVEKDYAYEERCSYSQGDYEKWRNILTENRASLQLWPIGSSKFDENRGEVIYNWYNDYGVWQTRDMTLGQTIGNFIYRPFETLTGKTLLETLLKQAQLVLRFIEAELRNLIKSDIFWPIVGVAVLLVGVSVGAKALVDKI
jgi:hypothetical protein